MNFADWVIRDGKNVKVSRKMLRIVIMYVPILLVHTD